jgi:hypothetical protein
LSAGLRPATGEKTSNENEKDVQTGTASLANGQVTFTVPGGTNMQAVMP